ncbi:phosphatidylserine/phosphatidylglycerophosphate/cardiolipin synthase family protein [Sphingomonas sp. 1P06PA]|uniref:phospholipase D-like domain-containing protein n=1 Tax=Sphingomonas sp. 1P06PA TaxID=554121 RepID=UPI0039A4465C
MPDPEPAATAQRIDLGPIDVAGHRLTLLPDGPERMDALIALIDGAERTLRLLYYIYCEDDAGRTVRAAIARALERGVRVSLIVDGFGSDADDEFFAPIKLAGAEVCRFLPRIGRRYLLRNHQKLALADEARVIIGGFNVEDSYFGPTPGDGSAWRDLGLLVEGEAAGRLARYFDALSKWSHTPKAKIRDLRRTLKQHSETEGPVRWLMGGPTRRLSPWAAEIKAELRQARRADLIAGYFAPNPGMLRPIEGIVRRGGSARVVTAAKSDNNATIAAARHTYHRLLKRGVRVFEYQATKLHTKLFVVDDASHIGSANYDMRSLYVNLELMIRIEDASFADLIRRYFEQELASAREIGEGDHERAGWFDRIKWGCAYFLVAVLDYNLSRRLNFGLDGR